VVLVVVLLVVLVLAVRRELRRALPYYAAALTCAAVLFLGFRGLLPTKPGPGGIEVAEVSKPDANKSEGNAEREMVPEGGRPGIRFEEDRKKALKQAHEMLAGQGGGMGLRPLAPPAPGAALPPRGANQANAKGDKFAPGKLAENRRFEQQLQQAK